MARILYWNINNFTDSKIGTTKRKRDDEDWDQGSRGPDHLRMIIDTLQAVNPTTNAAAVLDFIVVVEIYARVGTPLEGALIGGSGLTGCTNLAAEINRQVAGNWSLVPPIVTGSAGQREAIAVFYNRTNWYFLGPASWPQAYPPDLDALLPGRTIPANYPYRANMREDRGAGQWQFRDAAGNGGNAVYFPGAGNRKPWLTAFGDVNNINNLVRIMAIHTKPNERNGTNYADQATTNLASVYDMTARPPDANNQVDVIVGDFNVDNLPGGNFTLAGPFSELVGNGVNPVAPAYTALVRPPAGLNAQYNSYYHTHGKPSSQTFDDTPAQIITDRPPPNYWQEAGSYPGQRYSGLSIDNALVRYHNPPGPANNMTILARARQQPYNAPAGPPPTMPMLGHYQAGFYMNESIQAMYNQLTANPALAAQTNWNEHFRSWENYGLVYSVSDHFALLFDV